MSLLVGDMRRQFCKAMATSPWLWSSVSLATSLLLLLGQRRLASWLVGGSERCSGCIGDRDTMGVTLDGETFARSGGGTGTEAGMNGALSLLGAGPSALLLSSPWTLAWPWSS